MAKSLVYLVEFLENDEESDISGGAH